jgi:hypothetical protein
VDDASVLKTATGQFIWAKATRTSSVTLVLAAFGNTEFVGVLLQIPVQVCSRKSFSGALTKKNFNNERFRVSADTAQNASCNGRGSFRKLDPPSTSHRTSSAERRP